MYVGELLRLVETPMAIQITTKLPDRRYYYLPRSQVQIVRRGGHMIIYVPDWIIDKNRIDWENLQDVKPIGRRHEHGYDYSHFTFA